MKENTINQIWKVTCKHQLNEQDVIFELKHIYDLLSKSVVF